MEKYVTDPTFDEIHHEVKRARSIHGAQSHLPNYVDTGGLARIHATDHRKDCQRAFAKGNGSWSHILMEEVAEAIDEARRGNARDLREELIQVGAMVMAWIDAIDGVEVR